MSDSSTSGLATRLGRKIARRQRLARWGKWLIVPTLMATIYGGRRHEWFVTLGFALLLLEILFVILGELQRCPRCNARLVIDRGWDEEFPGTCPECGCPID